MSVVRVERVYKDYQLGELRSVVNGRVQRLKLLSVFHNVVA